MSEPVAFDTMLTDEMMRAWVPGFVERHREEGCGDYCSYVRDDPEHAVLVAALERDATIARLEAERDAARIVLMDVDGCVNLIERGSPIRSGIALLVDTLVLTGHEVVLWSAGGAEHAEREASRAGFNGSVRRYLTKPDYPMTLEAALAVVGVRPVLQIDDDPTERVADWPFAVWHNASDEANALRAELATLKARVEGAKKAADLLGYFIYRTAPADLPGYEKGSHPYESDGHKVYVQTSVARGTARNAAKYVWWTLGSGEFPEPMPDGPVTLDDIRRALEGSER